MRLLRPLYQTLTPLLLADLAQHCRLLLYNHPRFPRLVRMVFLYPLYALSELAIISTDLAELLGSAIGLVLLFPSIPLPVAVLLTATDVVFILALGDSSKNKGRPVRVFEFIIIILVSSPRIFYYKIPSISFPDPISALTFLHSYIHKRRHIICHADYPRLRFSSYSFLSLSL